MDPQYNQHPGQMLMAPTDGPMGAWGPNIHPGEFIQVLPPQLAPPHPHLLMMPPNGLARAPTYPPKPPSEAELNIPYGADINKLLNEKEGQLSERDLKILKRKQANRESARRSKERKKAEIETLRGSTNAFETYRSQVTHRMRIMEQRLLALEALLQSHRVTVPDNLPTIPPMPHYQPPTGLQQYMQMMHANGDITPPSDNEGDDGQPPAAKTRRTTSNPPPVPSPKKAPVPPPALSQPTLVTPATVNVLPASNGAPGPQAPPGVTVAIPSSSSQPNSAAPTPNFQSSTNSGQGLAAAGLAPLPADPTPANAVPVTAPPQAPTPLQRPAPAPEGPPPQPPQQVPMPAPPTYLQYGQQLLGMPGMNLVQLMTPPEGAMALPAGAQIMFAGQHPGPTFLSALPGGFPMPGPAAPTILMMQPQPQSAQVAAAPVPVSAGNPSPKRE